MSEQVEKELLEALAEAAENKAELKAEIERLKLQHEEFLLKHEREKNLLLTTLDKQAGEILRLQGLVKQWSETGRGYEHKICDQQKLITELADALSHYALLNDFEKNLIQRAREGTK